MKNLNLIFYLTPFALAGCGSSSSTSFAPETPPAKVATFEAPTQTPANIGLISLGGEALGTYATGKLAENGTIELDLGGAIRPRHYQAATGLDSIVRFDNDEMGQGIAYIIPEISRSGTATYEGTSDVVLVNQEPVVQTVSQSAPTTLIYNFDEASISGEIDMSNAVEIDLLTGARDASATSSLELDMEILPVDPQGGYTGQLVQKRNDTIENIEMDLSGYGGPAGTMGDEFALGLSSVGQQGTAQIFIQAEERTD